MNLKLTFWDVNNTDVEDFYKYLDKNETGISVDDLITFVKNNHTDRPNQFSFMEMPSSPQSKKRLIKKKTYKQQLLEDSFRSTSLPNLSRLPYTSSVVSLGRNSAPA